MALSTAGALLLIAAGIGAGALAIGIYDGSIDPSPAPNKKADAIAPPRDRKSGREWWVQLYNYEKGNPDRRQKGLYGPYATKAEAEARADREKDVWYVKVVRATSEPWDTEKRQARRRAKKRSRR